MEPENDGSLEDDFPKFQGCSNSQVNYLNIIYVNLRGCKSLHLLILKKMG